MGWKSALLRMGRGVPGRFFRTAGLAACLVGIPSRAPAQDLTIAAAADLQAVMPVLTAEFQKAAGKIVRVTYGSSGNFVSQIQNGAPFDLFMSADIAYPRALDAAGLVEPDSTLVYGTGQLVIWARKDAPISVTGGLAALEDPRVHRVAVANPEHAPYGRAAVAALQHERLYDAVKSKLVFGENVSQAAAFIQSGNAEAGIIALSLALSPALRETGIYAIVPPAFYPPLEQAAVILKSSRHKDTARAFLAFLRRPETTRLLQSYGFGLSAAQRTP